MSESRNLRALNGGTEKYGAGVGNTYIFPLRAGAVIKSGSRVSI
ncbi:MAG: hypothetical protein QW767_01480 [Thermoprotei archaeon]